VTEERQSYKTEGVTLERNLARWQEGIPAELLPPPEGSPKARILSAAARQFADHGFSKSTTRAIAEAAGVNQAMIHYYFQSKTRLYERVLAGIVIELLTGLARSLSPRSSSPVEILAAFPERIISAFASEPVHLSIFRHEVGTGAPHLRAVFDQLGAAGPRGFRSVLMGYIDSVRGSAEVADEDAGALLEFLLVHAYGTLLVEPMLRHVFGAKDEESHLRHIVKSQRRLLRRALATHAKEEDTR